MRKLIAISLVLILLIGSAIFVLASAYQAKSGDASKIIFKVERGDGIEKIADKLDSAGIISNKLSFKWYSLIANKRKVVAGDHPLAKNMSIKDVLDELNSSRNLNEEKSITIIEGWTLANIADYLDHAGIVSSTDFIKVASLSNWKDKYDFLAEAKGKTVDGFLFPDTYRIFSDATSEDIIKKMLDNFDRKFSTSMRSDALSQGKSIFEIVTMASIIEREGKYAQDRKMISDVFWKRIDAGIALQSDATVNYITGKGLSRPTGEDLAIDSPYNTYKYRGLPPGPVSNPGLISIQAALYPISNSYYYFITDKDGHAIFAKTFDEHKKNIAKYLE